MSEAVPTLRPGHIPLEDAPRTKDIPDAVWDALEELNRAKTEQLNAELEKEAKEAPVEKDK